MNKLLVRMLVGALSALSIVFTFVALSFGIDAMLGADGVSAVLAFTFMAINAQAYITIGRKLS